MTTQSSATAPAGAGTSSLPFRSHYLFCCSREIHYVEWGAAHAAPVFLWHGMARTGRDFDDLAAALAGTYRVICPDMLGRGLSQWSPAPYHDYCLDFYAGIVQALVEQLGIKRLRWVGTSMGGALGIRAAATTLQGRISHLVLNDIGALVRADSGTGRIMSYIGNPPQFDTMIEFENYLRIIYKPYGWLSEVQWRRMAETSARRLPNGRITTHYDPAIVHQYVTHPHDYQQWNYYDRLDMPTFLLRGADSDLLPRDITQEMTQRGPRAHLVEIPDCGHAPALNIPDQIDLVAKFLAKVP